MANAFSFIIFISLNWLQLVSTQFLQTCSSLSKFKSNPGKELKEHKNTNRDWSHFFTVMPPFLVSYWQLSSLTGVNNHRSHGNGMDILEIGCGGGKTSLGFQVLFPTSNIVCMNKASYRRNQASTTTDILRTLSFYRFNITCDSKVGFFHLPFVSVVNVGLNEAILPFHDDSFDLIISQNSLDMGKFKVDESRLIPHRILRMLKDGGYAALSVAPHVNYHFDPSLPIHSYYHRGPKTILGFVSFQPLLLMNWKYDTQNKRIATILLYVNNYSVGMTIRKCKPGETLHEEWGCLLMDEMPLPSTKIDRLLRERFVNFAIQPQFFNSTLSKKAVDGMTRQEKIYLHREYTTAYLHHLVKYLISIDDPI